MERIKIINFMRSYKPSGSWNTKGIARCPLCGKLFPSWDTQKNLDCPFCKGLGHLTTQTIEELKEENFRLTNKLYSPWRAKNIISAKEMGILSSFRETLFMSDLNRFIDSCFRPREQYSRFCLKQYQIDTRGLALLKNPTFMDLIENCYNLVAINKGGESR